MQNEKIPLVVLAGPTASGKTAAGIYLAQQLNGEVISADSMQIYRHLTVGTAKPTEQEMQGVPHHLIDFLEPSESFSVADYVNLAKEKIAQITAAGKLPILVGGTGLYISSLVDNINFSDEEGNTALREEYREFADKNGVLALWERLSEVDPEAAEKIHPNNVGRVARALEVYHTTGIPISQHQKESRLQPSPYRVCMMAINFHDRQKLYDRINLRVTKMLEEGLEQEARWLLQNGYGATSFQAIGYKEMVSYLEGKETLEEACDRIRQESRRYAKRQLTWFRRDKRYRWFYAEDFASPVQMYREMAEYVKGTLSGEKDGADCQNLPQGDKK